MRRRLPILLVLTLLIAPFTLAGDADKLTTCVIRIHRGIFADHSDQTELSPPGKEEKRVPKLVLLPPTLDGQRRYDVLGWLETEGLQRKPGMSAIYLDRSTFVVITASPADIHLAEAIMACPCLEDVPTKEIRATADLWIFEADGLLEPAKYPHTLAELRALAGPSLKLLDAHTLITKSGNRTVGENLSALPRKPAPPAPAPASPDKAADPKAPEATAEEPEPGIFSGSRGSVLEIEPNIGPDGETLDFQISYQARFAQSNGEPDAIVKVSTNSSLQNEHDMVLWLNAVPGDAPAGKVRHRALTMAMQILDQTGRPVGDVEAIRKRQDAANRELIRRAQEGLENILSAPPAPGAGGEQGGAGGK